MEKRKSSIIESETGLRNAFFSYRRGWTDGAKATAMSPDDKTAWYSQGYKDGYDARKEALGIAANRIGYVPSPLRVQG